MHSFHSIKPIGHCKGCPLNLKKRCGVFSYPALMWAKGACRGYMNGQLHAEYVGRQAEFHAKTPRELRRERARMRRTEPHHNGVSNPGGSRW